MNIQELLDELENDPKIKAALGEDPIPPEIRECGFICTTPSENIRFLALQYVPKAYKLIKNFNNPKNRLKLLTKNPGIMVVPLKEKQLFNEARKKAAEEENAQVYKSIISLVAHYTRIYDLDPPFNFPGSPKSFFRKVISSNLANRMVVILYKGVEYYTIQREVKIDKLQRLKGIEKIKFLGLGPLRDIQGHLRAL